MQIPEQLTIAVDNYLAGTATEEEVQQVNDWFHSFNDEEVEVVAPIANMREWLEQNMREKILHHIPGAVDTVGPAIRRVPVMRRWGWVAASALLLAVVATWVWSVTNKKTANTHSLAVINEILPGSKGAILTLADGSQVLLDSMQKGTIALQDGVTAKIVNNTLLYEGTGHKAVYNTMTTPRGRQFHIVLPDGTKVWLNASSSIRYPTVFAARERKVEITGEAYFEVAKNKALPFKVVANDRAIIEVLGTHFNVNAYKNEEAISTTLMEGSIKMNGTILTPGQQAVIDTNGMSVQPARIDNVMAWKNGLFDFNGLGFDQIMRQLERWYAIDVVYTNHRVPNKRLAGEMTRSVSLNTLLDYLGSIGVRYRLDGRTLTILP